MKCAGLHCPGCGDGGSIPVVAALLIAAEVILRAIWWIIGVTAASAAIALAIVVLLARATARREAAYAASPRHQALIGATLRPHAAAASVPAIEQHIHYHLHAEEREAARIIRIAPPGKAGGPIRGEKPCHFPP